MKKSDSGTLEWLGPERVKKPKDQTCAVTVGSVGLPLHPTDLRDAWRCGTPRHA